MRRDTGSGKVNADFFSNNPSEQLGPQINGNLFNFDFDGDNLKLEHEYWLARYAVPLLQGDSDFKIVLQGEASSVGNAQYNDQLAKRRALNVKSYLMFFDVQANQIEDSSVKHDPKPGDNEHDRGVEFVIVGNQLDPKDNAVKVEVFEDLSLLWGIDPLRERSDK